MSLAFRSALTSALWPLDRPSARSVFAVLDGARSPRIAGRVEGYFAEKACLYAGTLSPALVSAAPHLVQLYPESQFYRALVDDGWGRAWGVFMHADTSLESLRRHLRGLLVVRDPRGRRLLFRWYDPRVLRVYLPTCTRQELETVFGPVTTFLVEAPDPTALLRFTFDGDRLDETIVALGPPTGKESDAAPPPEADEGTPRGADGLT